MNELYPIFLKVHQLPMLLVGAGEVGAEKLHFLLKSSPHAQVTIVSKEFSQEVLELANRPSIQMIHSAFEPHHLDGKSMVIAATDDPAVNEGIYHRCRERNLLVNVADHPQLCDFYLGGIVTKGNLKLAISTNGKSPTMAKRLREFFEAELSEDLDDLLENMHTFRKKLTGDFNEKLNRLNELTKHLNETT